MENINSSNFRVSRWTQNIWNYLSHRPRAIFGAVAILSLITIIGTLLLFLIPGSKVSQPETTMADRHDSSLSSREFPPQTQTESYNGQPTTETGDLTSTTELAAMTGNIYNASETSTSRISFDMNILNEKQAENGTFATTLNSFSSPWQQWPSSTTTTTDLPTTSTSGTTTIASTSPTTATTSRSTTTHPPFTTRHTTTTPRPPTRSPNIPRITTKKPGSTNKG